MRWNYTIPGERNCWHPQTEPLGDFVIRNNNFYKTTDAISFHLLGFNILLWDAPKISRIQQAEEIEHYLPSQPKQERWTLLQKQEWAESYSYKSKIVCEHRMFQALVQSQPHVHMDTVYR